jgi:hypothetical protein
VYYKVDTMFLRKMSGGATSAASGIFPSPLARADHTILFDNSTEEGYRLVAVLGSSEKLWFEPIPAWAAVVR